MFQWQEKLFYGLTAVVLGGALFAMGNSSNPEVASFQHNVQHQFTFAAAQVFGDQPVLDNVDLVIASIDQFYARATNVTLALLTPPASEDALNYVAATVYTDFALATHIQKPQVAAIPLPEILGAHTEVAAAEIIIPPNFMQEQPIYNIIPGHTIAAPLPTLRHLDNLISGEMLYSLPAVNDSTGPWSNMRDSNTGQVYCIAIFNGTPNQYIGPCKHDFH
jgi:hypothetical protein